MRGHVDEVVEMPYDLCSHGQNRELRHRSKKSVAAGPQIAWDSYESERDDDGNKLESLLIPWAGR